MFKKQLFCWVVIFVGILLLVSACGSSDVVSPGDEEGDIITEEPGEKLKVAISYNGPADDDAWASAHEVARKNTEAALDFVEFTMVEMVSPGTQAEQVFSELCEQGYDVIIGATMAYEADIMRLAPSYPDTKFLICSGSSSSENVESFWPDRTALWYLLGKVAGSMSETNKMGFTGSNPIPLVLCVQNAFLLGAQSVNPDMEQIAVYIQVFYDPAAELDAALSLADAGCDTLWNNTDSPSHVVVAEERGLYAYSQYADQREFGPNSYISGEVLNWEAYYIEALTQIYNGTWEPTVYFPDIRTGASFPQELTHLVPDDVRALYQEAYDEILACETIEDIYKIVYAGPIYDTNGVLRVAEGEYMTPEEVQEMDWMVLGTTSSVR